MKFFYLPFLISFLISTVGTARVPGIPFEDDTFTSPSHSARVKEINSHIQAFHLHKKDVSNQPSHATSPAAPYQTTKLLGLVGYGMVIETECNVKLATGIQEWLQNTGSSRNMILAFRMPDFLERVQIGVEITPRCLENFATGITTPGMLGYPHFNYASFLTIAYAISHITTPRRTNQLLAQHRDQFKQELKTLSVNQTAKNTVLLLNHINSAQLELRDYVATNLHGVDLVFRHPHLKTIYEDIYPFTDAWALMTLSYETLYDPESVHQKTTYAYLRAPETFDELIEIYLYRYTYCMPPVSALAHCLHYTAQFLPEHHSLRQLSAKTVEGVPYYFVVKNLTSLGASFLLTHVMSPEAAAVITFMVFNSWGIAVGKIPFPLALLETLWIGHWKFRF